MRLEFLLVPLIAPTFATADCLSEQSIREKDAAYETALVTGDYEVLEGLLHPSFVWVHNHAGLIQRSREALVGPIREDQQSNSFRKINAARVQSGVSVVRAGDTSVIYGFTDVRRTRSYVQRTGNPERVRYHFMRTYAKHNDNCTILSNHTQEVWREG